MANAVVYSHEGTHRDSLRKTIMQVGLNPSFTSEVSMVTNLINEVNPVLFVLDWHSLDPTRNAKLLRTIDNMDKEGHIIKIICCEQSDPSVLAIASETNIRKVISYGLLQIEMNKVLSLIQVGATKDQQFATKLRNLRSNGTSDEKVEEAIELALKEDPKSPVVRLEFAMVQLENGAIETAEKIAKSLLAENKSDVRAMNLLSRILMKKGDFDAAEKILQSADILSPKSPERLVMLGDLFYCNGDTKKAESAYSQALEEDPGNKQAIRGMATMKLDQGDTEALVSFFSNNASESEIAGFFNNAAVQNVKQGKLEESLQLYDMALKVIKSDKFKAQIFFNKGLNLRRLRRIDEAIKAMKRALNYAPDWEKAMKHKSELEQLSA